VHLDAKISAAQLPPPPFKSLVKGTQDTRHTTQLFSTCGPEHVCRHCPPLSPMPHAGGSTRHSTTVPALPSALQCCAPAGAVRTSTTCRLRPQHDCPRSRFPLMSQAIASSGTLPSWLRSESTGQGVDTQTLVAACAAVMISKIDNCMLDLLAFHERAVAEEKEQGDNPKPWTNILARAGDSLRRSLDSHRRAFESSTPLTATKQVVAGCQLGELQDSAGRAECA